LAAVGNQAWQKLADKVMGRFVNARARFFDADDHDGAVAWLSA
jgi:hypothetical protein